jgi:hypothetical protein
MLSLEHLNRIDLYLVIGLLVILAVNLFVLMRRR